VEFILKVVEEKGEASWLGVAVCVELLWLLWHHRVIDDTENGYSKMATILAPDGHQLGGCDYVDSAQQKWTNRHCPNTADNKAAEVDYQRPLAFVPLPSSLCLYIHPPIRLHEVVLNYVSTGTTLPFIFSSVFHLTFLSVFCSFPAVFLLLFHFLFIYLF
jgi:hypothetical protein